VTGTLDPTSTVAQFAAVNTRVDASNVALTDGLALKVNLTTFNALQTSTNLTRTFGWADNSGTQAVANLYISKVGNQVQAIVSAFRVNAGNTSRSFVSHTVALPAEYIPSQNQYGLTFMLANTAQSTTGWLINTTGFIQFYAGIFTGNWASGTTNIGPAQPMTLTWVLF